MTARRRVAILISGRGSNMRALVEAAKAPDYPAEIVLVLSNRADAAGLAFAASRGIETALVAHRDYATKRDFETAMDARIRESGAEIVCLAGFMRLLTPDFVERWAGRMLNIHPSLLPAFKGLDTHERALAAGVKIHGCTVHFVSAEVDSGPIVAQAAVAVRDGDTADSLAARVLAAEHQLYPDALRRVVSGDGPGGAAQETLFSPPLP